MIDLSNMLKELNSLADGAEREGRALLEEAERIRGIARGFDVSLPGKGVTKTFAQRRAIKAKAATILKTPPWEDWADKSIGSLPVKAKKVGPKRKYTKKAAWWGKSKAKKKAKKRA